MRFRCEHWLYSSKLVRRKDKACSVAFFLSFLSYMHCILFRLFFYFVSCYLSWFIFFFYLFIYLQYYLFSLPVAHCKINSSIWVAIELNHCITTISFPSFFLFSFSYLSRHRELLIFELYNYFVTFYPTIAFFSRFQSFSCRLNGFLPFFPPS